MRVCTSVLSALLLLTDVVSSKAIFSSRQLRRSNYEAMMQRAATQFEGELERRSPDTSKAVAADLNINSTVSSACNSAISNMNNVTNVAGFAGCYNILSWDPKTMTFQADLRLFQHSQRTGEFANISASQLTLMLTYSTSTQFTSLVKRSSIELSKRDNTAVQIQQYSLAGTIQDSVDVSRLNETLLVSLMTPQISLQAKLASSPDPVTTNMTASDSAWFVAGTFTTVAAQASQVANPATAVAAILAAQGFILPGTTFGIFPTGLIITSVWTLLFSLAFGMGTVGRIKSRAVYRRRVMVVAPRV